MLCMKNFLRSMISVILYNAICVKCFIFCSQAFKHQQLQKYESSNEVWNKCFCLHRCLRFDSEHIVSGDYGGKIKVWDSQAALDPRKSHSSLCICTLKVGRYKCRVIPQHVFIFYVI